MPSRLARPTVRDEMKAEPKKLLTVVEEVLRRIPDLSISTVPEYLFGGGDYSFIPSLPGHFTPGQRSNGHPLFKRTTG